MQGLNSMDKMLNQVIDNMINDKIEALRPKETIIKETVIRENIEDSLKLYSVKEANEFLGIGENNIRRLIENGQLKAIKFKSLKISALELQRFLNESAGQDFTAMLKD
ncbi:helix-turn-helix domain-containing protein [Intestinibacter sp.]